MALRGVHKKTGIVDNPVYNASKLYICLRSRPISPNVVCQSVRSNVETKIRMTERHCDRMPG